MRTSPLLALGLAALAALLPFTACGGSTDSTDGSDAGASCPESACGSPPPVHCANGATATLTCARGTTGACGWGFQCPDVDAATDAPPDLGVDAPGDSPPDAADGADAPACPTLKPTRLSKCDMLDQVCIYACGSVLRCTSKGWDDDFTVDGGPPCP